MNENPECRAIGIPRSIDISDEDVYDAMKGISGYLDITPGDQSKRSFGRYRFKE